MRNVLSALTLTLLSQGQTKQRAEDQRANHKKKRAAGKRQRMARKKQRQLARA